MKRAIDLFGVPTDLGAARAGSARAPSALRQAGLVESLRCAGYAVDDHGDLSAPSRAGPPSADCRSRFATPIAALCRRLAGAIEACDDEALPLTLGGDHSVSIGSIGGFVRRRRPGVLWFDAHGDFNTPETTPSGNVHGMPLAVLCGMGDQRLLEAVGPEPALQPNAVALIGARSLDPGERRLLAECGVLVYPMAAIERFGIRAVTAEAIGRVMRHADCLHVSLDPDVLDPTVAPGAGTPVPGGLTAHEACAAMQEVACSGALRSMDLLEVNPLIDEESRTVRLACTLVLVALGARLSSSSERVGRKGRRIPPP